MNLYFDVDAGHFVTGPATRERVDTLSFKRGDTVSLAVRFVSGLTVQELGVGAAGKIGLKEEGEYDADFVASDTAWTKTGTGTSTVYTFELNLATTAINALLGHDSTEGNDVASVDLMLEMEYTVSGVVTSSNTITATVYNDVVKGSESGPTLEGGTIPPRADDVVVVTGTLTDGTDPVTFPTLYYAGEYLSHPSYTEDGEAPTTQAGIYWVFADSQFILTDGNGNEWVDDDDLTDPTAIVSWVPVTTETGTPVTTFSPTPGFRGTMKVDSSYLYVVSGVADGVPTWRKIAHSAL